MLRLQRTEDNHHRNGYSVCRGIESSVPFLFLRLLVANELFNHVLQLLVARGWRVRLGGLVSLLELFQFAVGSKTSHVQALHLPSLPLVVLSDVLLVQTPNVCRENESVSYQYLLGRVTNGTKSAHVSGFSLVQVKMATSRSGKSVRAPLHRSDVSLVLPLKQFHCWSH